jgi:ribosomal protein S11
MGWNDNNRPEEGQDQPQEARSNITRTVGYTKQDGTTDTMDVYVDPDGNTLTYERGGPLVIPEYERRAQEAAHLADPDLLQEVQEEYEEAREARVRRLHERAAKARESQEA